MANLRNIANYHAPIDKMRVVAKTSRLIVKCIDQFWEGVTYLKKDKLRSKLALDADQMILISIYITL